jgi:hypothetical protein
VQVPLRWATAAAMLVALGWAKQGEAHDGERTRRAVNSLYVEVGGGGAFYSLNYERTFWRDFSARVGLEVLPVSLWIGGPASTFLVSGASWHGLGNGNHAFEVGAGAVLGYAASGNVGNAYAGLVAWPTASVGYRFQPLGGGFLLRAGISAVPAPVPTPVFPWPYLAFGGTF